MIKDAQVLVNACKDENLAVAKAQFALFSPNEVLDIQEANPDVDITGHPLWVSSETWGFEVAFLACYRYPEEDHGGVDPPDFNELTPDKPLGEHLMWGLSDQMDAEWGPEAAHSYLAKAAEEVAELEKDPAFQKAWADFQEILNRRRDEASGN